MKELIKFSIKRRFFNKATLFFNIIFLTITLLIFNLDKVMALIQPEINDALTIMTGDAALKTFSEKNKKVKVTEKEATVEIKVTDNNFTVYCTDPLNGYQTNVVIELLNDYYESSEKSVFDLENIAYYREYLNLNIEFINKNDRQKTNNNILAFMVVTTIYFMMISFSAMAANEVVYEKSTKLLETVLTTLPVSAHFFGKMLIGWLNIIIQSSVSGSIIGSVFFWRYFFDKGTALCECLQKLDLIDGSIKNLHDITKILAIDGKFIGDMFFIMIILMLGIVSVQVIMVSISSFVSNIEEAGNIQSPMYIIFMGLYYFSLSMNQPAQLSKGLGKLCSFLPITSMLFMPYRIMLTKVSIKEVFLAIAINSVFLVVSLVIGRYLYGKGILYNKGTKIKDDNSKLSKIFANLKQVFNGDGA